MRRQIISSFLVLLLIFVPIVATHAHGGEDHSDTSSDTVAIQGDSHGESQYDIVGITVLSAIAFSGGAWVLTRNDSWLVYGMATLLVASGVIHLIFGMPSDLLLIANGLGYIVLATARFLPIAMQRPYSTLLDIITIGYAVVTIIGYFVTHTTYDPIGLITKSIEVLLIGLVAMNMREKPQFVVQS
ncbi:MAG: hypothetical protein AAF846_09275 [Chloroflexota bacterium]